MVIKEGAGEEGLGEGEDKGEEGDDKRERGKGGCGGREDKER